MKKGKNKKKKICFAASTGGHFEQLMMLKPLMKKYDSFILTEKTSYGVDNKKDNIKLYTVNQVNRKEIFFIFKMIIIAIKSLIIYIKERPNVVITTGVLAMIPICLIVKLFGGKLIFIESFAKINSPTLTGKFVYKYADRFYVQWEQMLKFYPNAIYKGGIY